MIEVTADSFEQEVLKASGVVVCDFYTDWCYPCKKIKPEMEKLAETKDIKVVALNAGDHMELARKYNISTVPTIVFFKDGQEVDRLNGLVKSQLLQETAEKAK